MSVLPQLNTGSFWDLPLRSDYSEIRAFLAANPGYSATELSKQLNQYLPGKPSATESVANRIRRYKQQVSDQRSSPVIKACPTCLQAEFHCDMFNKPWLIRCPIHGCELEMRCPSCGSKWPTVYEVRSRRCDTCGLHNDLVQRFVSHQTIHTDVLTTLRHWLYPNPLLSLELVPRWPNAGTWKNLSVDSDIFPSAVCAQNVELKTSVQSKLHISRSINWFDVKRLTSAIQEDTALNYNDLDHPQWRQQRYRQTLAILRALRRRFGHPQPVVLMNPENIGVYRCLKSYQPCPICMALSLWITNNCHSMGISARSQLGIYDMLRHINQNDLSMPSPFSTLIRNGHYLVLDGQFQHRSYRIALRQSFAKLFTYCIAICRWWFDDKTTRNFSAGALSIRNQDQSICLMTTENELQCYIRQGPWFDPSAQELSWLNETMRRCVDGQTQLVNATYKCLILDNYLDCETAFGEVEAFAHAYL